MHSLEENCLLSMQISLIVKTVQSTKESTNSHIPLSVRLEASLERWRELRGIHKQRHAQTWSPLINSQTRVTLQSLAWLTESCSHRANPWWSIWQLHRGRRCGRTGGPWPLAAANVERWVEEVRGSEAPSYISNPINHTLHACGPPSSGTVTAPRMINT